MDILNEAVLVTGASRGLGKELARAFARRGAKVVLVARGEGELTRAVAGIHHVLERALARAEAEGLLGHEMGDACLVWGVPPSYRRRIYGVAPSHRRAGRRAR